MHPKISGCVYRVVKQAGLFRGAYDGGPAGGNREYAMKEIDLGDFAGGDDDAQLDDDFEGGTTSGKQGGPSKRQSAIEELKREVEVFQGWFQGVWGLELPIDLVQTVSIERSPSISTSLSLSLSLSRYICPSYPPTLPKAYATQTLSRSKNTLLEMERRERTVSTS